MTGWHPDLSRSASPRYMAIADLIGIDLAEGRLAAGERLPPQRQLATRLGLDFTTVARGYAEAQKRGLVQSHVGRGTFVTDPRDRMAVAMATASDPARAATADFSMNMPPEPEDPALILRMREGLAVLAADLPALLRYQSFGGSPLDRQAAALWLKRRGIAPAPERIFVIPGAHAGLLAILSGLARPGDTILSECITYPGIRSLAAQTSLRLRGLAMDRQGILPDAFDAACRDLRPKALYLNPTLQNPLTLTVPENRRREIAAIAARHGVPVIEDDAYGFVPSQAPTPFAALLPELTWHIGGLSKCLGAGLRLAFVAAPDTKSAWPFVSALRATAVMASPLTAALATRWIGDGTADAILAAIRQETAARQALAAAALAPQKYRADPLGFNIWLPLTNGWTRSTFASHVRACGLGVVASDAFTVEGPAPEAVRVCLGGPVSRETLRQALDFMAHALRGSPEQAASFF